MDIKKIGKELLSVVFKYETFTQKKEVGETLLLRLNEIKVRQRRRQRIVSYSVAATVAIFVAAGSYVLSVKEFNTDGEVLAITLPDNSQVRLDANSSLSYNRILWHFERSVSLTGDAQFKVTSGDQFVVQTTLGDVRVVGTEFSISSSIEKLNVECFEGSVEVVTKLGAEILHKGDMIECTQTKYIFTPQPDYYQYSHASVADVLERIESVYGVIVLAKDSYTDVIFDGAITTEDLTEALDVLTLSCDMSYRIENDTITLNINE